MTLRALQSAANNQNSEAPMTWRALSSACQSMGAPEIGYDEFAARWETDPILKKLVDRFDGAGLVIKTNNGVDKPAHKEREGHVAQMAKHATKRAFN